MSELVLPASPWTGRANRIAGLAALVSLIGVAIAWNGVSRQATFDGAQSWFVFGVFALLIGLLAAVLWLSGAAKRIHSVRRECHEILRREFGIGVAAVPVVEPRAPRHVRAAGMVKVHLETCELVVGKEYDEVPVGPDTPRCGVCCP
jgi:hypothetical protein